MFGQLLLGSMRRSAWFWWGVLLIVSSSIAFIFGVVTAVEDQRYGSEGQYADGLVLKGESWVEHQWFVLDDEPAYRISYEFTTLGGETFGGSDMIRQTDDAMLDWSTPVRIEYLTSRPTANRVAEADVADSSPAVAIVSGVVLLGGIVATVFGARQRIFQRRRLSEQMRQLYVVYPSVPGDQQH